MGYIKTLSDNFKTVLVNKITSSLPVSQASDGLGFVRAVSSNASDSARQAIYPQWFFSSRLGQPRQVNISELRKLSRSPWIQMVLNTVKREIKTIPWDVVPVDEKDETDYSKDIELVKLKLNNINEEFQDISDILSEAVTDIGEIDAGVLNTSYTNDSYDIGELPVFDMYGNVSGTENGLVLKPLGQRTLSQVKSVDGGSMLKQVDIHKSLLRYYQYSFKHPRQNPTAFEKEEIVYMTLNGRPYSVYGFSPLQSIQQVIELLIQGTRYNKDLYTNNAVPDMLVSLPKLSDENLKKLKRKWNNNYKGKPHQVGFINWIIENVHKLAESNRDLEWLDGQKWYFKLVFAVYGVSPTEAGFFENANKSNDEGQARVTVRNAIKPYLNLFEKAVTRRIVTEILQDENPRIKFVYCPTDHEEEKTQHAQNMMELDKGALTINEYRKSRGKDPVEWGDEPLNKSNSNPESEEGEPKKEEKLEEKKSWSPDFKKKFERFVDGRSSA